MLAAKLSRVMSCRTCLHSFASHLLVCMLGTLLAQSICLSRFQVTLSDQKFRVWTGLRDGNWKLVASLKATILPGVTDMTSSCYRGAKVRPMYGRRSVWSRPSWHESCYLSSPLFYNHNMELPNYGSASSVDSC